MAARRPPGPGVKHSAAQSGLRHSKALYNAKHRAKTMARMRHHASQLVMLRTSAPAFARYVDLRNERRELCAHALQQRNRVIAIRLKQQGQH